MGREAYELQPPAGVVLPPYYASIGHGLGARKGKLAKGTL